MRKTKKNEVKEVLELLFEKLGFLTATVGMLILIVVKNLSAGLSKACEGSINDIKEVFSIS